MPLIMIMTLSEGAPERGSLNSNERSILGVLYTGRHAFALDRSRLSDCDLVEFRICRNLVPVIHNTTLACARMQKNYNYTGNIHALYIFAHAIARAC
jgi:hypothetical protein